MSNHTLQNTKGKPPHTHTRYPSSPAAATLLTRKNKVSCSGFLPKTMPMQHSCSHCNVFRSNTHTSMQPLQSICIHTLLNLVSAALPVAFAWQARDLVRQSVEHFKTFGDITIVPVHEPGPAERYRKYKRVYKARCQLAGS